MDSTTSRRTGRVRLTLPIPPFRPRWPWIGGDLQTVRNTVFEVLGLGRIDLEAEGFEQIRFTFPMPDGSDDRLMGTLNRPLVEREGGPLMLLIHGLAGCETSSYMLTTAKALLEAGYRVLRLNLRGAGPTRSLCRGMYHAGRSEDLHAVLNQLAPQIAGDGVVIVGYSLGGNMLLKALGERGKIRGVVGAVSVSAPVDLKITQKTVMLPRNRLYHGRILQALIKQSLAGASDPTEALRAAAASARSVYEFDDVFVAPRNGFAGADAYYEACSARRFVHHIKTPTLIVHAKDDPWIPIDCYRDVEESKPASVLTIYPPSGGHVGFHTKGLSIPWHDRLIVSFVDRLSLV